LRKTSLVLKQSGKKSKLQRILYTSPQCLSGKMAAELNRLRAGGPKTRTKNQTSNPPSQDRTYTENKGRLNRAPKSTTTPAAEESHTEETFKKVSTGFHSKRKSRRSPQTLTLVAASLQDSFILKKVTSGKDPINKEKTQQNDPAADGKAAHWVGGIGLQASREENHKTVLKPGPKSFHQPPPYYILEEKKKGQCTTVNAMQIQTDRVSRRPFTPGRSGSSHGRPSG